MMQYSLDDVREFIATPTQYKHLYTDALLRELIETLYPEAEARDEVLGYLALLPDHANSIRVQLACVHLSVDSETDEANMDRLIENIDCALQDYRDLLMAYYL